jgi:hypothetical protein
MNDAKRKHEDDDSSERPLKKSRTDVKHIMIDLETLGTNPRSPIVSIGAKAFSLTDGELEEEFYQKVDIACYDKMKDDFVVDYDTIKWWSTQSNFGETLRGDLHSLQNALTDFLRWVNVFNNVQVWAQGQDFDFPVLKHAFTVCGMEVPWKFWNQRDTRTVYSLVPRHKLSKPVVAHNALQDCKNQIKVLCEAFKCIE